ncbi:MAG: hypothetical protein SFY66_27095 [Oculatellaceae cyanobacterium bins.114]|nr:hypothetical protein [Oculatellaceae cyanobacterium bins.114]
MEQFLNLPTWTQLLIPWVVLLGIVLSIRLIQQKSPADPISQPNATPSARHYLALKEGQINPEQFVPIADRATIQKMLAEATTGNRTQWDKIANSNQVVMVPVGTAVTLKGVKERLAEVEVDGNLLAGKAIAGQDQWTIAAFVHKKKS